MTLNSDSTKVSLITSIRNKLISKCSLSLQGEHYFTFREMFHAHAVRINFLFIAVPLLRQT